MDSAAGAVALLIVLVAVLALGFVALWVRDKKRADEEAHDIGRIMHDPTRGDLKSRTPPEESGSGTNRT